MNEIKFPSIPSVSPIKFKFAAPYGPQRSNRRIMSTTLPLWVKGVTPPRPDPGHTPSYIGGTLRRIGFEPPKMNRKLKRKYIRFVKLWCRRNLTPLIDSDVPTVKQWLKTTDYTEARKQELLREWQKYGKMPRRKVLRKVKSFIKDETYLDFKFPRLINSRVDIAKCLFGPLCYAVAKRVFALPQFIKTVPVSQRPKVLRDFLFKDGEEMDSTDYTSFEAHFTDEKMEITQKILFDHMTSTCGSYLRRIAQLMFETLSGNNEICNKILSFIIKAKRCSGEMDTSLSNGFTNAMNIEFLAYLKKCSVRYFVEGDDGLAKFRPPHLAPTVSDFQELGFLIKVIRSKDMAELSFCGQVYDVDECVVVTDVREQLARFGWTNSRYVQASYKTRLQLLRAKGFSMVYQYTGCPILSVLGRRILELTNDVKIEKRIVDNYDSYHKHILVDALKGLPPPREPGLQTRLLVEKLYSISIDQQVAIESKIRTWTLGGQDLDLDWPKQWTFYHDKYSTNIPDHDPSWLLQPEKPYLDYIRKFSNVTKVIKQY